MMPEAFFTYSIARPKSSLLSHLATYGLNYPGNTVVGLRDGYAKVTVDHADSSKLTAAKLTW
jgi:hypothetical protein